MRTLLSNGIRPRIGHLSRKQAPAVPSTSRRALGAARRRRLCFNDAFTLLLAPVLGTVLIADTTLKDRKKKDWDAKIAEVLNDLAIIQEKELQTWHNLQIKSIHNGMFQQRRSYTTQAAVPRSENITHEATYGFGRGKSDEEEDGTLGSMSDSVHAEYGKIPTVHYESAPHAMEPADNHELDPEVLRWQFRENTLAWKLAIELTILAQKNEPAEAVDEDGVAAKSIEQVNQAKKLRQQLQTINDRIYRYGKYEIQGPVGAVLQADSSRQLLDDFVTSLAHKYRTGRLSAAALTIDYTNAVVTTRKPLSLSTYATLLEAMSARDPYGLLPNFVMKVMRLSKQLLTNRVLWAAIWHHGESDDLEELHWYLAKLARPDKDMLLEHPWEHVLVRQTRVPAPINRDVKLLNLLLKIALRQGMTYKAEAWAILICQQTNVSRRASVFRSVLSNCSKEQNWILGYQWIQKAVMWMAVLNEEGSDIMMRTIFRLLELCVACYQEACYDQIMQAVVGAGIIVDQAGNIKAMSFTPRGRSIRLDWTRKLRAIQDTSELMDRPSAWKARRFQEIMAQSQPYYAPFIGVTDPIKLVDLMRGHDTVYYSAFDSSAVLSPQTVLSSMRDSTASSKPVEDLIPTSEHDVSLKISDSQISDLGDNLEELNSFLQILRAKQQEFSPAKQTTDVDDTADNTKTQSQGLSLLHLLVDHKHALEELKTVRQQKRILTDQRQRLAEIRAQKKVRAAAFAAMNPMDPHMATSPLGIRKVTSVTVEDKIFEHRIAGDAALDYLKTTTKKRPKRRKVYPSDFRPFHEAMAPFEDQDKFLLDRHLADRARKLHEVRKDRLMFYGTNRFAQDSALDQNQNQDQNQDQDQAQAQAQGNG